MPRYRLQTALLADGWHDNVLVTLSATGFIEALEPGAAITDTGVERIEGIVIPGMANAHSHAFQRGMAGNAEYRGSARDSFWTWRRSMYALANRIEPEDLRTLATQLFIEMLKSGYTAVAEFHYLHRQIGGAPYGGTNALWNAVDEAADEAGIALTFLPTLYQTSDFGGEALRAEQARFALDTKPDSPSTPRTSCGSSRSASAMNDAASGCGAREPRFTACVPCRSNNCGVPAPLCERSMRICPCIFTLPSS
jgi:formimidoylglutamate deiminase